MLNKSLPPVSVSVQMKVERHHNTRGSTEAERGVAIVQCIPTALLTSQDWPTHNAPGMLFPREKPPSRVVSDSRVAVQHSARINHGRNGW